MVSPPTYRIDCLGRSLELGARTHIMGVINCTPDSFYPASRRLDSQAAVALGLQMVEDGADLLDVGGESTRPGSEPVAEAEEWRRVIPVIEALADRVEVPISIDTYKASVARAALGAGAGMINDISGLQFDPTMVRLVAESGAPVIIMHIKGRPKDMQRDPYYEDVVAEVSAYFRARIAFAREEGVRQEQIVLDPGIGFGKRLEDNYALLARLDAFAEHRCPLLVGPSRKSFIGRLLGLPPEACLEGTLAAATAAVLAGAHIIRGHDVSALKRAVRVADEIKQQMREPWMRN